jgi:hypothetical protein
MDAKTALFYDRHNTTVRPALEVYAEQEGAYVLAAALDMYADPGHNDTIDEALEFYAGYMRETAAQCAAGESQPGPEAAPKPGMISIRPTRNGFAHMVRMFTETAERADQTLAAYRELTGYVPGNDSQGG